MVEVVVVVVVVVVVQVCLCLACVFVALPKWIHCNVRAVPVLYIQASQGDLCCDHWGWLCGDLDRWFLRW